MSFIWGDGGEQVTQDAIARRRKVAEAMIAKGTDFSPVDHWTQGAARVAQALLGGWQNRKADEADKKGLAENQRMQGGMLGAIGGAPAEAGVTTPAPAGGGLDKSAAAISGIESDGRYDALGPVTKTGDRAYGKYQVMGANVGPWTKQYLGREMTPQEFLASQDAQDKVFQGEFGRLSAKHGPNGAARAWFAGEGGMNDPNRKDQLGTSVADYGRKFDAGMGGADVPAPGAIEAQGFMPPGGAKVAEAVAAPGAPMQGGAGRVAAELAAARQALGSPYANETTKKMALAIVERHMKAQEPQLTSVAPGSAVIDARTGRVIYRADPKDERPTDVREFEYGQRNPEFAKRQMELKRAGATSVNLGGGSDKQIFDAMQSSADAARAAATGLNSIRQARAAVQGGGIFGAGADARLGLAKIGAMFGADPTKIVNTETFRSAIAPQVASLMKATVGSTQISNADREFAEKAAGGSINLDEKSITRLLDIMERGSMAVLEGHTSKLNAVYPDGQNFGRERSLFGVQTPEAPAAPGVPQLGQVENGYRFKGGNPADPNAWEKVQ